MGLTYSPYAGTYKWEESWYIKGSVRGDKCSWGCVGEEKK